MWLENLPLHNTMPIWQNFDRQEAADFDNKNWHFNQSGDFLVQPAPSVVTIFTLRHQVDFAILLSKISGRSGKNYFRKGKQQFIY